MPKLRKLSGTEVVSVFLKHGFVALKQKGSHVKLRRVVAEVNQTLVVPKHRELDTGTLKAIFNQALRYIPESELRPDFYTK